MRTIKDVQVKLGLNDNDLKRLDVENIKNYITTQKSRLKVTTSNTIIKEIEDEVEDMEMLLKFALKQKKG